MLTLQELRALSFDSDTYLIGPELLPEGGKLFLAAAEKTGKSFLLLNAALDMAAGRHLWNGPFPIPHPLRVLYLDKELGPKRLKKRLAAIAPEPSLFDGSIFFESKNSKVAFTEEGVIEIMGLIERSQADVVIYDPLSRFVPGADENNQADMSMAMHRLDVIMELTHTTSILAHHLSKPSIAPRHGAQRMRGSTVLSADLDTYIEATRLNAAHHKTRTLQLSFITRDEPVEDQYLRLADGHIDYLGLENPMKHAGAGRPKKRVLTDQGDGD